MGGCDKEEEEISYITQSTIKEDERNLWCPKVKPSVSRVIIQRMLHTEQLATRLSVIKKQINQVIRMLIMRRKRSRITFKTDLDFNLGIVSFKDHWIFKFDTIYFMLKCQSGRRKIRKHLMKSRMPQIMGKKWCQAKKENEDRRCCTGAVSECKKKKSAT